VEISASGVDEAAEWHVRIWNNDVNQPSSDIRQSSQTAAAAQRLKECRRRSYYRNPAVRALETLQANEDTVIDRREYSGTDEKRHSRLTVFATLDLMQT